MTSRISFLKKCKEYRRHHLAEPLMVIFFVFFHLLAFVISLQNYLNGESSAAGSLVRDYIIKTISPNFFTVFITGLLGALIGMTAFSYLHSRTKTDFYHSLPVTRSEIYIISVISNILTFLIPAAAGILLECAVCAAAGHLSVGILATAGITFVAYGLCFTLCFLTESLAMILTGHLAVGFLGGCVFALYVPLLLYGVFPTYAATFFHTYATEVPVEPFYIFSPLTLSLGMLRSEGSFFGNLIIKDGHIAFYLPYLIAVLLWIVILFFADRKLFMIRKSEMAGRSMAFSALKTPLRFLLVIPAALFTGWGLYEITLRNSRIWMVLGIVLGCVIFHGLIEAIYQMDLRGLWSHRLQLGITVAASLLIAVIFWMDIPGYDSWLPGEGQIRSVIVRDDAMVSGSLNIQDRNGDTQETMQSFALTGKDAEAVLDFLRDYVGKKKYDSADAGGYTRSLQCTFILKNGKEKSRIYLIPVADYQRELDQLYSMEGFKQMNCPLYAIKDVSHLSVHCSLYRKGIPYAADTTEIAAKDMEDFLKEYLADYAELTCTDMLVMVPSGSLDIATRKSGTDNEPEDWMSCYIYPTFDRTIQWLYQKDYLKKSDSGPSYQAVRMDINYEDTKADGSVRFSITDENLIRTFLPRLVPIELTDSTALLTGSDVDRLELSDRYGADSPAGEIPVMKNSDIDSAMDISVTYKNGSSEWNSLMRTDKKTAAEILALQQD